MKQIVLLYHLITVVLGCAFLVVAQKAQGKAVSAEQAALLARKYVKLSSDAQADVKAQTRAIHSGTITQPPYYIFNDAQGRGFVVVAADDAMGQVLAYGTEAPLDTLTANPSVKWLLNGYRQTYEALDGQEVELNSPQAPAYYLKRESDVITLFQGFVTSIEGVTDAQQPFTIHREGNVLTVSAHGLLSLRLYDMAGHQLKQCSSANARHASLSLQGMKQEPYLLRIETAKHTYAYRFIGISGL